MYEDYVSEYTFSFTTKIDRLPPFNPIFGPKKYDCSSYAHYYTGFVFCTQQPINKVVCGFSKHMVDSERRGFDFYLLILATVRGNQEAE